MNDIVREQAERIILEHARDVEMLSIAEMLGDLDLDEDEYDQLCKQVDAAIRQAHVTVTWPGEPKPSPDANQFEADKDGAE